MKHIKNILILFLLMSLSSCKSEKKPFQSKTITLNLQEGDPPSLNPYVGVDLRSRCLFLSLFEPLMRRNSQGELEPAAAESVVIDTTQTRYTFHIRPHKWSNGEPVTSYHFEKAWKYALNPNSYCIRSDLFYLIKNAEKVKKGELPLEAVHIFAPDGNTLVVELEHPTPYFLDLTASSFFSPLYQPSDEEPTVFNGPFKVAAHIRDQKLTFQKNPFYWDVNSIDLSEIHFAVVRDPHTALSMFEKGELDLVGDPFSSLPFDAIPTLEQEGHLQSKLISRIFYLLLNSEAYPFHSKLLRKALALSIDRKQLTEHLFFGEIPTLTLVPKTISLLDDKELTEEDPILLFNQALEELNLTRETFPKIVFSYAELSGQKKLAEYIQREWKEKLGIEIELVCSEWNVHMTKLRKRDYQMGTLHLTTLYQDPMFYFDLFRTKEAFCNYCGWEDPFFKVLLEESEKTASPFARTKYLKRAEKHLFEEMPAIPIFTQNLQYLTHKRVQLVISDLGIYDFKSTKIMY